MVLFQSSERFRGVAVAGPDVSIAELERMDRLGVRGLRFNHFFKDGEYYMKGEIGIDAFDALHDRMVDLGWHMQLWINCCDFPDLWPRIEHSKVPVIVDHMGRMEAHHGTRRGSMGSTPEPTVCAAPLTAPG